LPRLKKIAESGVRIAEHGFVIAQRRDALRETCAQLLAEETAFVWEIGCGHGHFLAAYAAAHPDRLCIGIDLVPERIARANRKRERAQLANVHFLRAEARDFLAALPDRARFSAIYILFPDPWPKRRHHKHRIMQAAFMQEIAARAGEGARLYFRTDHDPYFADVRSALSEHAAWRLLEEPWPFEMSTVFQQRAQAHHSLVAAKSG
jgi:tRNA (guanine-N7-)-methyltransferase